MKQTGAGSETWIVGGKKSQGEESRQKTPRRSVTVEFTQGASG